MQMWQQYTPKRRFITSYDHEQSQNELMRIDYEIDVIETMPELELDDDPDSDGYGWERKALRGIY